MEGTFAHVVFRGKWRLLLEEDERERKREEVDAVAEEDALLGEERIPIVKHSDEVQIRVYGRRWLVLFSFVMMALVRIYSHIIFNILI